MPKTYEYVSSNDNLMLVKYICKKDNNDERVSDEVCYNRVRVFNDCKKGFPFSVENEKQVEAIINSCNNYKIETIKEEINVNNII
jgi:hypothetical protein